MWEKFKQDFMERFMTFETAKGIYLIPAGLAIMYVSVFYMQYIIQATGIIFGWYMTSEGMRKVFVNRIKQAVKVNAMVEARMPSDVQPTGTVN